MNFYIVASTVAALCLVSNSFMLMAFPSLIEPLLHQNQIQNHTVKPLVNILHISLEVAAAYSLTSHVCIICDED